MEHMVKVTVLDKKLFSELQAQYCAVPDSGKCPCYNVGDEFMFYRNNERDDYWRMGAGTLIKSGKPDEETLLSSGTMHCGTEGVPFCSEAWDAISRYIYSALQGGAIMHGWMNNDNVMITCCNDGTASNSIELRAKSQRNCIRRRKFRNNFLDQKIIRNRDEDTYLYVKGDFEPIISEEQWDRCRQIKEQRVRRNKILTENGEKSHLTGVHTSDDVWTKKLRCTDRQKNAVLCFCGGRRFLMLSD